MRNKDNSVENTCNIEEVVDKQDQRICKVLQSNFSWVVEYYTEKN